ncbi:hypothetical protein ACFXG1_16395 [Streptomyces sp. NPDC059248]|uniref:hypothetical protein n=1 Tax=Streptomyces sp. NPDC059248 TaxID=3346791 RepID=UPI00368CBBBC
MSRRLTATAAVLALAMVVPGTAYADPPGSPRPSTASAAAPLPDGWRIAATGSERYLEWRSERRVPIGDARVGFFAGDRLIGYPEAVSDGHTFRLPLDEARIGRTGDLRVTAGGRRLDAAGSARKADEPPGASARKAAPYTPPPVNAVDPGVAGPYATTTGEYRLPSVRLPGMDTPVEMTGVVVSPREAPGKRPLALFLHGRHTTCYTPGGEADLIWPCADGQRPIPSHKGYLRAQRLLASQGYATVSISANGINAQDHAIDDAGAQARSSLVRLHLARWAGWAAKPATAPAAIRAGAPADLSRVLLVGHSRGGEGVNRAAMDSLHRAPADQDGYRGPVRWRIRGTVLIGPTLFGQNPAPDVPSATILPGCDGDVSDLQGQMYPDAVRGVGSGTALHSAIYMVGANHNYFNSEWTPGQAEAPAEDDFWHDPERPDPVCAPSAPTRLTADRQQRAGATYIAAAAQLFVGGDDRLRPLLDGTGRRAPSAGPARVHTHAVGGHRAPVLLPDSGMSVTGGRVCDQVAWDEPTACLPQGESFSTPHFALWHTRQELGRKSVTAAWTAPGTPVRIRPARPVWAGDSRALALRVAVPPDSAGTRFDVAVTDASGRRAVLGGVRLDGLPGSADISARWAQEVRVGLGAAVRSGVDTKRLAEVELTPRSRDGELLLIDAWGWRAGTPAVRQAAMPRIDVGRLTVQEGDSGERTYHYPVRVSGKGTGRVWVYTPDPETGMPRGRLVTVRPGVNPVDVTLTVRGNTRFSYDDGHAVSVKTARGAVVGSDYGGITTLNDDPMPEFSAAPVAADVTEGEPLTWRVSLSQAADAELWDAGFHVLPVTGGPEVSTTDVGAEWLAEYIGTGPEPERPLSVAVPEPYFPVMVPVGRTSVDVAIPTERDGRAEPMESLRLRFDPPGDAPHGPVFTGTVRDAS